jgi:acid phosphatase (class A)
MHLLIKNESATSGPAKRAYPRARPWIVDPAIKTCTPHPAGPGRDSYPSGHSSVAFAMATVLVALMPSRSKAILTRAQGYADNRIVCGYHFRSDDDAGRNFGIVVGKALLHTAAFKAPYDRAAAELRAAHLAP